MKLFVFHLLCPVDIWFQVSSYRPELMNVMLKIVLTNRIAYCLINYMSNGSKYAMAPYHILISMYLQIFIPSFMILDTKVTILEDIKICLKCVLYSLLKGGNLIF